MTLSTFVSNATAVALLWLGLDSETLGAQRRYLDGVFVGTSQGPFELLTYAGPDSSGRLRLTNGSMDDVPTLGRAVTCWCRCQPGEQEEPSSPPKPSSRINTPNGAICAGPAAR